MDFRYIQLIGFLGMLCAVISFQKNKRSFTLKVQILGSLFFALHFFLLGAWTGALLNILSGMRAHVFNLKERYKWINHRIVMLLFIALFWAAGALTWQGWRSILPIISMTVECFALWNNDPKSIRRLFLLGRPAWIAYDYLAGSYAGLATEVFVIVSILVAVFRFDISKKKVI